MTRPDVAVAGSTDETGIGKVLLTDGAARDLDEEYAAAHARGGPAAADRFLDQIRADLAEVGRSPEGGRVPPELVAVGFPDVRQVVSDSGLRLVYTTSAAASTPIVLLVAPAGRSLQSLLLRRLLDA